MLLNTDKIFDRVQGEKLQNELKKKNEACSLFPANRGALNISRHR